MDYKEGIPTNSAPLFDGTNYETWSIRMRIYLQALGFGIWKSIKIGYTNKVGKESCEKNEKAIEIILNVLPYYEIVKVMECTKDKQIWDKLQNIYEERSSEERSNYYSCCESKTK
jgi:hypothetical protein